MAIGYRRVPGGYRPPSLDVDHLALYGICHGLRVLEAQTDQVVGVARCMSSIRATTASRCSTQPVAGRDGPLEGGAEPLYFQGLQTTEGYSPMRPAFVIAHDVRCPTSHELDGADARGQHLVTHLGNLAGHLQAEQAAIVQEIASLRANIEHIKVIVTMQQRYVKLSGVSEIVSVVDLVEDSLRLNAEAFVRHQVEVIRDFQDLPVVNLDKHKIDAHLHGARAVEHCGGHDGAVLGEGVRLEFDVLSAARLQDHGL
jgi:hypothetical protein